MSSKLRQPQVAVALVLGVAATVAYSAVSLARYARFTVTSWDNAIFEQAISRYAHGEAPIVTVKGPGYNIVGDHFSPIDVLVVPAYWIYPHAQTLLVVQAVLLGISVGIIAWLAVRHLGLLAGSIFAGLYAVSFGMQSAVAADFHEVAFAAPLLAFIGAAYVERRWDLVFWGSLPLLLVKEDMGLTVAVIGFVVWLAGERRRGALLAAIGVAGWALVVWVFIPAVNSSGGYDYTGVLGGDAGLAETGLAGAQTKGLTVLATFAVAGLVAVGSPWALLTIPTFAWRFLGDNEFYWGTDWHYSLVLMPVVFVAAIDVLGRHRARGVELVAVAIASATCGAFFGASALASLIDPALWTDTVRNQAARDAIAAIPPDAVVESDLGLLTHLADGDRQLYWRGTIADVEPDCVVFDAYYSGEDPLTYALSRYPGTWHTVFASDGYKLVCRA